MNADRRGGRVQVGGVIVEEDEVKILCQGVLLLL